MTDERWTSADADGELLSAYLTADLDAAAAQQLEARLATEPALAAQLEALAQALITLSGADTVQEPPGLAERLEQRLAVEHGGATVHTLDEARQHRARSQGWWAAIGTAAAVVAVGTVMASGVLRGAGGGGAGDDLAEGGDTAAVQLESAARSDGEAADEDAVAQDAPEAAAGGMAADAAEAGPPDRPVVLDEDAVVGDEEELAARYADSPEVAGLLGLPRDQATALASSFTGMLQSQAPYRSGTAPGDCLATVTTDAEQPLIPARVESLRYDGQAALAYVMVTAAPGSEQTDRVEVWVVSAENCATLVFQQPLAPQAP